MSVHSPQDEAQQVDLSNYEMRVSTDRDLPLFREAVVSAKAGALRAAYVMIWLACAESLKRRFQEAKNYDNTAGTIVGKIVDLENQQRSVDKTLLKYARDYGFLSEYGHTTLSQIYELRSIFGHPYEEDPSPEQVTNAAATVVDLVLSKPVKLRHGYVQNILKDMLGNRTYLDDQQSAVAKFAKNVCLKLDDSIYTWTLRKYWEELEALSDDPPMGSVFARGIWFCHAMLLEVGVTIFDHDEWHELVNTFPKTLMGVCSTTSIFDGIGEHAQNSLIGQILEESQTRASVLAHLQRLSSQGALSDRQQERFNEHVSQLTISDLRASGLSTNTCYAEIIRALKIYDWYTQNPAMALLRSNGPEQAAELTEEQQENLGRNILQAADGGARSAWAFLSSLAESPTPWPSSVVRGVVLEVFTNDDLVIRAKTKLLHLVASILDNLDDSLRERLVELTAEALENGVLRQSVYREHFVPAIEVLDEYPWAEPLATILNSKLPLESQEES